MRGSSGLFTSQQSESALKYTEVGFLRLKRV